ncbi:hypothetical protein HJG60_011992 [Phyllostomus discolor]|uniref:Uncharacterized protein n=1 Tax=Phyllostomus discolor TaxID=89673 RepID=A0A833ZJE3_9CHIR|nr:hypothetical protein HJG60_011992 [Phyllostomus discolor]
MEIKLYLVHTACPAHNTPPTPAPWALKKEGVLGAAQAQTQTRNDAFLSLEVLRRGDPGRVLTISDVSRLFRSPLLAPAPAPGEGRCKLCACAQGSARLDTHSCRNAARSFLVPLSSVWPTAQ